MRISYGLLTQVALTGDTQAMNIMTQWEKMGDPNAEGMRTEAYFNLLVGFFLYTPDATNLPKRHPTLVGMAPMRERSGTLVGMKAITDLGSLDSPFTAPDIIITDDDGDPDGDD